MRIGFDAKRAFHNQTGLGVYSRSAIDVLSRRFPESDYLAYTPRGATGLFAPILERENVTVVSPPSWARPMGGLWRSWLMARRFALDGLDVFHGLSHELPLGIRASGVKSVVTIHDMLPFRFPELFPQPDRQVYRAKFRHACRNADRIVAVSSQTRDDVIRYFGTDPARIVVVHQGCDPAFSEPVPPAEVERVRARHGLPERYVLSVGAVIERKNLLVLVQAMEMLARESSRPVVLAAAGKGGAYFRKVREYVERNGLESVVRLLGPVPFADLPPLYAGASVFAYPSKYEGFGIPILEALSSRTPVVTSTGSCFTEPGGPDSLYVEPGNAEALARALARVLDDPELARTMAERGAKYAERFHEREVAGNLMAVYQSIIS